MSRKKWGNLENIVTTEVVTGHKNASYGVKNADLPLRIIPKVANMS